MRRCDEGVRRGGSRGGGGGGSGGGSGDGGQLRTRGVGRLGGGGGGRGGGGGEPHVRRRTVGRRPWSRGRQARADAHQVPWLRPSSSSMGQGGGPPVGALALVPDVTVGGCPHGARVRPRRPGAVAQARDGVQRGVGPRARWAAQHALEPPRRALRLGRCYKRPNVVCKWLRPS